MPMSSSWLQDLLNQMASDPASVRVQVADWAEQWKSEVGQFVGGVGRNATKLGFALVTLFFIYRDGEMMLNQLRAALWPFLGDRLDIYLLAIGGMAVVSMCGWVEGGRCRDLKCRGDSKGRAEEVECAN